MVAGQPLHKEWRDAASAAVAGNGQESATAADALHTSGSSVIATCQILRDLLLAVCAAVAAAAADEKLLKGAWQVAVVSSC